MRGSVAWLAGVLFASILQGCGGADGSVDPAPVPREEPPASKALVGKRIFFDEGLSSPVGQACASCHAPEAAFADPRDDMPVSRGVLPSLVGNRSAPSAAYAVYSPDFFYDVGRETYVGGAFWDGRAANLVEQAKGPFLNPLEMQNPDRAAVVEKLRRSAYADLFQSAFGPEALEDVDTAYNRMAEAVVAYELTGEVNRFTSKYDLYLRGEATLTAQEMRGLSVFERADKGNCAACHPSRPGPDGAPPLFTDFTYDNLGIPRNLESPFLKLSREYNPDGEAFVDRGLGQTVHDPAQDGKFKVPTLRNVAVTAPYGHNGYFKALRDVVEFYNTRDLKPSAPPPEVAVNVNREELGDLRLTSAEVDALVAFLETLTDGYAP